MKQIVIYTLGAYLIAVIAAGLFQRSLLYIPSHEDPQTPLKPWIVQGHQIGYRSEVQNPQGAWLMLHGNAGQASNRDYALPSLPAQSSLYILEYPGYGSRPGSPSMVSINTAAKEAYEILKQQHAEVAVLGESIGSGPAAYLATLPHPPSRIVLVTPFDTLANTAAEHMPWLPVRLILRDKWDNIQALKNYKGPIDIFAAANDEVIPKHLAKNLASRIPAAKLHEIPGGHNDWSAGAKVRLAVR